MVYAGVAQVSVGPQLMAAIVPGILLALAFALLIFIYAVVKPSAAPRMTERVPFRIKAKSIVGILPIALIVILVIGGIASGLMTPTEAGGIAALVALIVGGTTISISARRSGEPVLKANVGFLSGTLREAVSSTAGIFSLEIGVYFLTRVMALTRVTNDLADWLVSMNLTPLVFLIFLMVLYLFLGMFLDPLAIILLTVPIFYEPIMALGIDPLWFGVFVVLLCEIALVTPPVGMLSYVVYRLAQDPSVNQGRKVTLGDVFGGVSWFIVAALVMVGVFIAWPDIVLWLPSITAN